MEHALGVSIVNYSEKSFAVLILIVMEHALGDQKQKIMKAKEISVLILIVMEHALGVHLRRRRGPSLPKS